MSQDDDGTAEHLLSVISEVVAATRPTRSTPPVRLDSRLDTELGLDSLSVAETLVRLEAAFGVSLPEAVLATAETPDDLLRAVVAAGPRRPAPSVQAGPRHAEADADAVAAPSTTSTLVDVLRWHAARHPERVHIRLLADGGLTSMTYDDLDRDARAVAAGLAGREVPAGSSIAIMLPTGRGYFATFFGALYAGCVPVPIYPPGKPSVLEEHLLRQAGVLDNARAVVLVTVAQARGLARLVAPRIPTLRHVLTPEELQAAPASAPLPASAGDTALLQYTSGSTGAPKGVVLTHRNLLANIRATGEAGGIRPTDVFVSWLPLYHDMGLIGSWLLSLTFGLPFVVMSPLAFLARPSRWLWAMHEHGGTVSGGPNFGFELCLRHADAEGLDGLDLSRWRIAFNGAEPVSPATVTRFAERFAAHGLDPGAITPVYGLAESAVALTVPPIGRGAVIDRVERDPLARHGRAVPAHADEPTAVSFVACGPPIPGHRVRIADEAGATLGERRQGRVQFTGPSATSGYHRNPEATRELFDGDWLDSGDLGYLAEGDLYLTGRVKDLIIRAGRNLHPSEIEEAVGTIDGVRKGCVAAFPTTDPVGGTEHLVVVAETRTTDAEERAHLSERVTAMVGDVTGTPPDRVVLAPPGAVPKTSSGKIRRAETRRRYEHEQLAPRQRAVWLQVLRLALPTLPARLRRTASSALDTAYGVYARAVFALVGAVVWVVVAVLPGSSRRWRLVRSAGRGLLGALGVPFTVQGQEHLPSTGAYVVAANHSSHVDPLALAMVLERPPVFAAFRGIAHNPLTRIFLRRMGVHFVERGDRRRGLEDTQRLTALVRAGRPVVFFPEGRRSPSPGLEPFRMGAFRVAVDADVPIVPVTIRGTRRVLPVGRRLPRRGPVTVVLTPPERATAGGWQGAVELQHRVRAAILEHCGELDLS